MKSGFRSILDHVQPKWYQVILCYFKIHSEVEMEEAHGTDVYCSKCKRYLRSFFI